jgi:hypothetical protein
MAPKRSVTPLAILVTTLLLAPAEAAASSNHIHHPTTNPVALALRLGERYWGSVPCHGNLHVTSSEQLPPEVSDPVINAELREGTTLLFAWTSFDTPAGPNRIELSPSVYIDCVVTLNAALWRGWRIDDGEWHWLCDVMTHELGHLFGHDDEGQTNPKSIEYPLVEPGSPNYNSVPECRRVVLWYGNERFTG